MDIEKVKEKVIKSIGKDYTVDLEILQGYDEEGNINNDNNFYLGNIVNKETKEKIKIQINKNIDIALSVMLKKDNKVKFCGIEEIGEELWKM